MSIKGELKARHLHISLGDFEGGGGGLMFTRELKGCFCDFGIRYDSEPQWMRRLSESEQSFNFMNIQRLLYFPEKKRSLR